LRLSVKIFDIVLMCLWSLLVIVGLQKISDYSQNLKMLQVLVSSFGNCMLIYYFVRAKHHTWLSIATVGSILACLVFGLLTSKSYLMILTGIFPFVNLASLTLMSAVYVSQRDLPMQLNGSEKLLCVAAIFLTFVLIYIDYNNNFHRYLIYRTPGFIFKPSSGAILISIITIVYFRSYLTKIILNITYVFAFKAMSAVALCAILTADPLSRKVSFHYRVLVLLLTVVFSLLTVYFLNQIYERSLWVSVATRLDIMAYFDVVGGGLGYGTNIAINALSANTPVSDGTLNLIKYQFGIFGISWILCFLIIILLGSLKGKLIVSGVLGLGMVSVNLPEIPLLSLLLPYFIARRAM